MSEQKVKMERDITIFQKAMKDMVSEVTSNRTNKNSNPSKSSYITQYDEKTVQQYIDNGNINQLREVSRYYFYRSGFYSRTLIYFSTLLKYYTMTTPQFSMLKQPKREKALKKYDLVLDYVDSLNFEMNAPEIMINLMIDGAYFAIVNEFSDKERMFRKLPPEYCRTIKKSGYGFNVLEFDVAFFDKISDEKERKEVLDGFPKEVKKQYVKYKNNGSDFQWVVIPPNIGVAFTVGDQRPPFISVVPAIINLEEYRGMDKAKDEMDLQKILVQKMPIHDGELVFSLEETQEIHKTTAKMLADINFIDVLTTFADVEVPSLKDTRQVLQDNLEKVEKSIYGEAGVSKEIFSPTRNLSLTTSLQNDLSYVFSIIQQIRTWVQYIIDNQYSDNQIGFKFEFLPVSFYNQKDMLDMYLKQAQSGYSKLTVAITGGQKQKDILGMTMFENDFLQIMDNLIPLNLSYTQSAQDSGDKTSGAPKKEDGQREQKTDDNKESGNGGGVK